MGVPIMGSYDARDDSVLVDCTRCVRFFCRHPTCDFHPLLPSFTDIRVLLNPFSDILL